MIINNKQVNIWRGTSEPPTIYHIWIRNDSELLLHNGTKWVVFIDNKYMLDKLEARINATVNGYKITDNPVLKGSDILTTKGNFVGNSVTDSLTTLDTLLTTQIID